MLQYVIVFAILALSVAYMLWKVYRMTTHTSGLCDGCQGCVLKDKAVKCEKKRRVDTKMKKKNVENLVE